MRTQFFILTVCLLPFLLCTCDPNQTKNPSDTTTAKPTKPDVIPPFEMEFGPGYELLKQASGDLDKDGIDEKVVVIETDREGDMGTERDIYIYKIENNEWQLWHRSTGAVLPSDHGGMMGDPFEKVSVQNGAVVFEHFGGSREKWTTLHRFRYQNENWELIGATVINEAPCDMKENFDYNLSSGNVIYRKVWEKCEDDDERTITKTVKDNFKYKRKELPIMDNFSYEGLYAVNIKTGNCYPPSACYEYEKYNDKKEVGEKNNGWETWTGLYTLGGHDESWMLTIQPKGETAKVVYYEIDGMFPPDDQMSLIFQRTAGKVLKQFDVDFSKNTFQSDLGKGKLEKNASGQTIIFLEKASHIDDFMELTLRPNFEHLIE